MADTILETITESLETGLTAPGNVSSLQVSTIVAIVRMLTNEPPIVTNFGDYTEISFTPAQQVSLRGLITQAMAGKASGAVRVNLSPVILPPVLKRLIPLLLGVFALGYIVHR
jgi:hypothetical protein